MPRGATCSLTSKAITIVGGSTPPSATSPRSRQTGNPHNPVSTFPGEGQFGRHAQHRIVAGVKLGPCGAEPLGGTALVCLARIRSPAAPDHARVPLLRPERIELDRLEAERNRMRRVAFERPGAGLGVEIGEQAGCGVL